MRLIKENTAKYESFSKSLQYFTRTTDPEGDLKLLNLEETANRSNILERYSYFTQNLFSFQKQAVKLDDSKEIHSLFAQFVKRLLLTKEIGLFFFDAEKRRLNPVYSNNSVTHVNSVNKIYKEGILDWIFETGKPTMIPEFSSYTVNGSKLNQIIFPIYDKNKPLGVLSVLTPAAKISEDSLENQAVQILLGIIVPLLVTINQKQSINNLYNELQVYQSKLNNDFRLYAMGELTEGLLEDILEPLQVILSNVDFIDKEYDQVDEEITNNIRNQVTKLSKSVSGISKFNGLNFNETVKNLPSDLNKIVREFFDVAQTTLMNLELECELDLEKDIPPILTDPQDVKHLLTNVFSLIKTGTKKGSGIVIQTKYANDKITLSYYITDYLAALTEESDDKSSLTLKIINELMRKNEGAAEFNPLPLKGTSIHLVFPLKRKLR